MLLTPRTDLFVNVILPLILGVLIYGTGSSIHVPVFINNHLPDGLWAYSLLSAILLVWQRRIVTGWVLAVFVLAIAFELGQYFHYIPGTGDILDVVTYFIFFGLVLALNPVYEKQNKTPRIGLRPHRFHDLRRLLKG